MTSVSFPPSSQNAALSSPYSLGSHFPLTEPLFPNGFLGEEWILGRKWSQWSRLPVSSPNSLPTPTHHSPPLPLLVQYPLYLRTSCSQIQSSIFVTQHSCKEKSVQSWPPLKKHLHNKSPFFYLKILFISLKRHLISQTQRASGYLAFTLANRLLFLSLFLRDVLPQ